MREVPPARELRPEEIAAAMDGVLRPHETEPDRIEAFLPSPCVQNHAANLAFLADGSLACVVRRHDGRDGRHFNLDVEIACRGRTLGTAYPPNG
jgi:hypothetical protein